MCVQLTSLLKAYAIVYVDEVFEDREISPDTESSANFPNLSVAYYRHRYHDCIIVGGFQVPGVCVCVCV